MIVLPQKSFPTVRAELDRMFKIGRAVKLQQDRWQGKDVRNDPAATTYELRNVVFEVPLSDRFSTGEDLRRWQIECDPNLPWADDHFLERVGGEPLNPGVEWANWPWAKSADRFRATEQFNHTYMERFWPKFARETPGGRLERNKSIYKIRRGINHYYGDLDDLVELLAKEPTTRQAYIPLFFPEDTGFGDGGRKPCTLGYQFLVRFGLLHIWYPLRSCDLIRHYNDDCYLAVRLLLWVLDRCRERNPAVWNSIKPGTYSMHITSLHMFRNDYLQLKGAP